MIIGNTTWEAKLAAMPQKKALYVLVIDDLKINITSFILADELVSTSGGYGTAYGNAYGES